MDRFLHLRAQAFLVLTALVSGGVLCAQTAKSKSPTHAPAQQAGDVKPDLNGVWDFTSAVPLERPAEWSGKYELTDAEAKEFSRYVSNTLRAAEHARGSDKTGYDFGVWYDDGRDKPLRHTSLIVDPANGRLPPLTEDAKRRRAQRVALAIAAGPEDYPLAERCIVGLNSGPPIVSATYNNFLEIFQNRDQVALYTEMIHTTRIAPLDGRPALDIPQWNGNSRGRWEGATLVVETTGFRAKDSRGPGSEAASDPLRVIERFSRVDADTLQYEYTVHDPATYTAPYTARTWMTRKSARVFEYACHEGNTSIANELGVARQIERSQAK
jgi:hypothetical protein